MTQEKRLLLARMKQCQREMQRCSRAMYEHSIGDGKLRDKAAELSGGAEIMQTWIEGFEEEADNSGNEGGENREREKRERKHKRKYMFLDGPGISQQVYVCFETEKHIMTSFGTFRKDTGEWILDSRFSVHECDKYGGKYA